jgi:hypothetical protein
MRQDEAGVDEALQVRAYRRGVYPCLDSPGPPVA